MNNTYTCAFCGKEYNTPEERMRCETTCYKKQEEEKLKAEQARIEEEKRRQQEEERRKQLELVKNRCKRIEEIKQSLNKFNSDYNTNYVIRELKTPFDTITPFDRLLGSII